MTVEEIEIIVTAKVEEALKEFNKIVPTVQKKMKEVQESFSKVDAREMKSQMQNAVNFAKRKIQDLKKSSENNKIAITVTNKDAKKQITQLEKEINSLQAKIRASQNSLKSVKVKISTIEDETSIKERTKMATKTGYKKNYTKQEFNTLDNNINNSLSNNSDYTYAIKQQEILNKNIEEYTAQIEVAKKRLIELSRVTLPKRTITGARTMNIENPDVSIWNTLESKIKSTLQAVKQSFSNVFSGKAFKSDDQFDFGKSENQLRLIELKIDKLETKIKKAQKGKIELSDEDIAKAEVELDRLYNQKEKIEKSSGGNFFSKLFLEAKKTKPVIEKITDPLANIKNQVNKMSSGLKNGLGHVIKYATALFSLRGIYSILSNSAQSWLSSQNAGAKQLSANIEYMKYAMGSALAPVIQFVTNLVYQLMRAIQSVAYALTGVNIFAKATASSMKSASSSAKQANKSLSSVHSEINNVSDNKNSGGSSSTPNIDLSKMENTSSSIIDAIKNGNWYEVGETIGQKINDAMNSIHWDKIQSAARKIGTNTAQFLNGGIKTINWNQVGNTFAQGINTAIYFAYNFVTTFDWKQFGKAIGDSINGFFNNIDWATAGKTLGDGIKGIFDSIDTALEEIDWQQIARDVEDFVKNIDWNGVVQAFFRGLGAAFGGFSLFLGTLIRDAFNGIGDYFNDKIEECGGDITRGIFNGIVDAISGVGQWINDNIFEPFINGFKNAFGIHSPSTVMIEMGGYIIDGLKVGLLGIWDKVKQPFIDFKNNLINKFAEIKSNISDWTENTKTTISNWGNDVKSKISSAWNNASQNVNSSVNSLKSNISTGLNNAKITVANWGDDIKNTFSNLGRNASTWGKDLADNMASGIKNNIHKVTSAVSSVANKIKDYLHFTEPDTGPLSNFHTYMPDMIDLMVKGIKDNTSKVKNEMENLAGTMSYTINTEPLTSIDTITSRIKPVNVQSSNLAERFEDALTGFNISNNTDRPIYLTVNVGDKKLGQILLDDLRDKTRRTGKDIEALIGG
nr:MAG TPA: tail tape measure protein [Caudoviricetes sp.]